MNTAQPLTSSLVSIGTLFSLCGSASFVTFRSSTDFLSLVPSPLLSKSSSFITVSLTMDLSYIAVPFWLMTAKKREWTSTSSPSNPSIPPSIYVTINSTLRYVFLSIRGYWVLISCDLRRSTSCLKTMIPSDSLSWMVMAACTQLCKATPATSCTSSRWICRRSMAEVVSQPFVLRVCGWRNDTTTSGNAQSLQCSSSLPIINATSLASSSLVQPILKQTFCSQTCLIPDWREQ